MKKLNTVLFFTQMLLIAILLAMQIFKERFFSVLLFWLITIVAAAVMFVLMLQKDHDYKLLSLILFDIYILSLFSFNFPLHYQINRDTFFEVQTAENLIEHGYWNPSAGTGYAENYYGYNPVIHILLAFFSLVAGVSVPFAAKYVFLVVFRIAMLVSVVLLLTKISDKRTAFLAALIYLVTARLRILHVSRRIAAVMFLLVSLIVLMEEMHTKKKRYRILFVFFVLLTTIADHSTGQLAFLFYICAFAYYLLLRPLLQSITKLQLGESFKALFLEKSLVAGGSILVWEGFFAPVLMQSNQNYTQVLVNFLRDMFNGSAATANGPLVYTLVQRVAIYASQLLLILFAGIIFLIVGFSFMRRKNKLQEYFYDAGFGLYFLLFGIIFFVLSLTLAYTPLANFTNVIIWLPLIGVSLLIAIFLRIINPLSGLGFSAGILIMSVLFVGGLLIQYHPTVLYPESMSTMVLEFSEYNNPYVDASGDWLYETAGPGTTVLAEKSLFDIYSGTYRFDMVIDEYGRRAYLVNQSMYDEQFLRWNVWVGSYERVMRREKVEYIAINTDVFRLPSYSFNEPLPAMHMEKFDASNRTNRIYDNTKIIIYENRLR